MFLTDLTAAVTTALGASGDTLVAGNLNSVADLLAFSVDHLDLGVTVSSLGTGTATYTDLSALSRIATYSNTFTVNGFNASIAFAETAITFPAGVVVNEGTSVGASPAAQKLWTVTVKIDGADSDSTVDSDEVVVVVTRRVKA